MTKQPDLYVPLLPEVCKPCGDALLIQIKRETSLYQISRFCEHITAAVDNHLINQPPQVGELITVSFENIYQVFDEFE